MAEKRITFSGIDAGVSDMMRKLRSSSQDLGREMMQQARQYSQSGKEQVSFIEQQIKAIERRNQLERQGREQVARQQLQETGDRGGFQKAMGKIQVESDQDDMQVKLLREVIETIRMTSREEISEDKKQVQQRIQEQRRGPLGAMLFGKQQLSPEDMLKTALQEEELQQDKRQGRGGGVFGDVFAGTFAANMVQQMIGALSQLPGARNEEQAIAGILGGIPILGGAYGRQTQEELQAAVGATGLRGLGIRRRFRMPQFGFDEGESAQMAEQAMLAAGTSDVNVTNFGAAQRAFNLDPGLMQQRLRVGRFSGQGDFLQEITKLLASSGLQEDRVLFAELLQNQTRLVEEFSQTAERVNQGIATDAIMMFNQVGGGFAMNDPRSIQRISQINRSLANPQNDIMQAENFAVLRRLKPQAGIFDIMQMQEQGLQTPGFAKGVLGNISNRFQGNDQFAMMALQQRLGLSFSATRQLFQNRQAILSGQMGEQEIQKIMQQGDVRKLGAANTADLIRSQAEIANAFVDGITPGMLDIGEKIANKIKDAISFDADAIFDYKWPWQRTENKKSN